MYNKFSLQAYTVRDHMESAEDVKSTFKQLAAMGYTGIQTADDFIKCPVELYAQAAVDAGLEIVGTHYGPSKDVALYAADDAEFEKYLAIHKTLNTKNAGIGGAVHRSVAEIMQFIENANRLGEKLSKYGMRFTYHHHSQEFAKVEGKRPIDLLVDGLDKKYTAFVIDTYWLNNAGVDVNAWIEKLAGRCDILHIKDRGVKPFTSEGYITEIGNGNLDFKTILKTAEDVGIEHICVEQDIWPEGVDSLECVRRSAEYLKNVLLK